MPPRGKKAGSSSNKEDTQKSSNNQETLPIEEEVPISKITSFIISHTGEKDSIPAVISLLLNSSLSSEVLTTSINTIFNKLQPSSESLAWGRQCIQSIFSETQDPKTRIKDAFFFPNPQSEKRLINYLKLAQKSLIVAVFTLTNDDLAKEVRNAKARGVDVRIISDDELLKMQGSDIRNMHNEGIQVRVDLDPRAQMHHKFCVIDDHILVTGSFNWTKQAVNKNQENLVVLDDPCLCSLYSQEFDRMWLAFEPSIRKYFGGSGDPASTVEPPEHNENKPYKKLKKSESSGENIYAEEEVKQVTVADIEQMIQSDAGDVSKIPALVTCLDSVNLPDNAVQNLIKEVFEIVQSNPTFSSWGKSCIQALFSQSLNPITRTKDAFFFPNPESEKKLIKYLKRANKTLIVAVFTLTNDDLAREIRNARSRGVQVRIISDDDLMSMQGSDIKSMYEEGIEVRVDLDPRAQMHHKFCVIDDYLLITGSFNWTKQAVNKNQENLVVLDDPFLAQLYIKEFDRMWEEFEPCIEKYFGGRRPGEAIKDLVMQEIPCDIKAETPQDGPESQRLA